MKTKTRTYYLLLFQGEQKEYVVITNRLPAEHGGYCEPGVKIEETINIGDFTNLHLFPLDVPLIPRW